MYKYITMKLNQIIFRQKKIERTLRQSVHPDNPLAQEMTKRYRELEELKKISHV